MAKRRNNDQGPAHGWTTSDSIETYSIDKWSEGFFTVNSKGHVVASVDDNVLSSIDIKALVDELTLRGIELPILLRFSDVLKSRIEKLNNAFLGAIKEYEYKNDYRGVFPIKVNQARKVVEEIVEYGRPFHYGLEAGSKPELMAAMAIQNDEKALLICNGYKDEEYIRLALQASLLGRTVVLVAEKLSEVSKIHEVSKKLGIKASIGIRAKLISRGSGRWQESGGDLSKFGLSAAEIMEAIKQLEEKNALDSLRLLHFHLGSQISSIRSIKNALREASRLYSELRNMGCDALDYLDVGGGLGVDYDGSQTNFQSSMNYNLQEYANDVVYEVMQVCDLSNVPHPTLISESGRAITAHCSVLVVDVLEVTEPPNFEVESQDPVNNTPIVSNLYDTIENLSRKNLLETYHDAASYREQALQSFNLGHLSLRDRVLCDNLYWSICRKIKVMLEGMHQIPDELEIFERLLADIYFLNFSMFQSLPDAWAVDQLFPIMPIHRLDEKPTRSGVLADITCDSDGCISEFIGTRDVKKSIQLHGLKENEPYYLGFFLVGAYQEILGDLHNLFGDTNIVHVSAGPKSDYQIEEVFNGDSMKDVLSYVNYSSQGLIGSLRKNVEKALKEKHITLPESKTLMSNYKSSLEGTTYLQK